LYEDIAALFAKRMIQNRDVKAIQFSNGDYVPDFRMKDTMPEHGGSPETSRHGLGFTMDHLTAHLTGQQTYGHYLLDSNSNARMFAFDIDLVKENGTYAIPPGPFKFDPSITNQQFDEQYQIFEHLNPRTIWLDRNPATAIPAAREWWKQQMMGLVHRFAGGIRDLGLPCAAAYSGGKGVHVYGFTGEMPGEEVRAAADIVMATLDEFEPLKGKHFFRHKDMSPITGFRNFDVEVFPKQVDLEDKKMGNLMRLPLGRNQKSQDPTFFLDLKAPAAVMRPHPNPAALLESGDPYA